MSFSWAVVERARNRIAPILCEVFHRRPLRKVLSNQSVCVFVGASLPRTIRIREVDRDASGVFDLLVSVELGAVVDGDGFEETRMSLDQLDHARVERDDFAAAKLPDQR